MAHGEPHRSRRWLRRFAAVTVALLLVAGVGVGSMVQCYRQGLATPRAEGEVRDVTQLVRFRPDVVLRPHSTEEVIALLERHDGPISIGGGRFSQGGQIGIDGTLFLDLRELNDVLSVDVAARTIRVEAGITWRTIQEALDPHDLSLKIMQSYANFTVGGSLSVNAHGRYVNEGPLVHAIRSLVLVTADGSRIEASRTENADVFAGVVGGYGGLGVVTEVTMDLAVNEPVERTVERMAVGEFRSWFDANIRGADGPVFFNADVYPPSYDDLVTVTFSRTDRAPTVAERLQPNGGSSRTDRLAYWWVSEAPLGKEARSKVIDRMRLGGKPVVWRNYEASYDAYGLEPGSRDQATYVLQEYFVPVDHFDAFGAKMAEIFTRYGANVINVSIRHAKADTDTLLSWAPAECFAFVIYYKQGTSDAARTEVGVWTRELIDAVLSEGGTYYLPYQILATDAQFRRAYPKAEAWFALKMRLDPQYRLRNALWDRYLPPYGALAAEARDAAVRERLATRPDYARPEDQTFLTLPEWAIVYSGDELGAYLESGQSASTFPYFKSVCQFCALYGAVTAATQDYPTNRGYRTMIAVIGTSYAIEYAVKGAYEGTIGRLVSWLAGADSPQDLFYASYASDYGAFMHHTPWYAFPFADTRAQMPAGPRSLRGIERQLAVGAELTAKSWWGWAMGGASASTYGAETEVIQAWVRPGDVDVGSIDGVLAVEDLGEGASLVSLQRYEPFTAAIQALVASGVEIVEIAGGHRLVVQVITPSAEVSDGWDGAAFGDVVFSWPILTHPGRQRVALAVPVHRLDEVLVALTDSGAHIEHLYDY